MAIDITRVKQRANSLFSGFTNGQKAMLGIAAVATIAGAMFLMNSSGQASYATLYSNLQETDAASVTQQLDADKVPYKLENGGTTILVPQEKVYQERLDLSSKGLPTSGSPGYALLDKQGITTSEFSQRVDYQRALEGEMVRTINAIDGVQSATVHLVIPQQTVFATDTGTPTASVLVTTTPGHDLNAGQVQAIVHLVASSVEGLDPKNVTVADSKGRVLSASGEEGDVQAQSDARASQTATFENDLSTSLQTLLEPVTGPGKAIVHVTAALDFDKHQTTTERFDAAGTSPVLSETSNSETFTGQDASASGVIDGSVPTGTGNGASNYNRTQAQKDYAVGKVTEQVDSAPGAVDRLSVAVLVDDKQNVDEQQIKDLVSAAAGLQPNRGDTIQVTKLAFDASAVTAAGTADTPAGTSATAAKKPLDIMSLIQTAGAVLIVLVVLFMAWRSARKASVSRTPIELPAGMMGALGPGAAATADQTAVARELVGAGAAIGSGGHLPALAEPDPRELAQTQIADLIDRQPEDVATVLRSWLADRRN